MFTFKNINEHHKVTHLCSKISHFMKRRLIPFLTKYVMTAYSEGIYYEGRSKEPPNISATRTKTNIG